MSVYWFFNSFLSFSISYVQSQQTWTIVGAVQIGFCLIVRVEVIVGAVLGLLLCDGNAEYVALRGAQIVR